MAIIELLSASPMALIVTVGVLGLMVGSFLNVVIYRLPLMLEREWRAQCAELMGTAASSGDASSSFNLITPRSACPACRAPITALQNVPLLSYLVLRGRCASCGVRISSRYPVIEALTGALSALVAWRYGFGLPALEALTVTWFLIALAFVDIDRQLLPDSLTLPLLWLGLVASLWAPTVAGTPLPTDMRSSILGAAAGYLSLWSVYHLFRLLTGKEGMGYGDFKLLAALGAWLGWKMLLPIVLMSALVGAVVGALMLTLRGRDRSTPIPFGPFLAAAGWMVLMDGPDLLERYWRLFAPHP